MCPHTGSYYYVFSYYYVCVFILPDTIVEEGFEVSAVEMFNLTRVNAGEFLEVYKGVLPEVSSLMITYAHVCSRMLTYAEVC